MATGSRALVKGAAVLLAASGLVGTTALVLADRSESLPFDPGDPAAVAKAYWVSTYTCRNPGYAFVSDPTHSGDDPAAGPIEDCVFRKVPRITARVRRRQADLALVDVRVERRKERGGPLWLRRRDGRWRVTASGRRRPRNVYPRVKRPAPKSATATVPAATPPTTTESTQAPMPDPDEFARAREVLRRNRQAILDRYPEAVGSGLGAPGGRPTIVVYLSRPTTVPADPIEGVPVKLEVTGEFGAQPGP